MIALRQEPFRIDPLRMLFGRYAQIPRRYRQSSRAFSRKVELEFHRGSFTVKTINTEKELEEVLQLRYEIFHREFQNKLFPYGIDLEPLDFIADHLVIVDKGTDKIVGTYRIVSSSFSDTFYSQSEFELDNLLCLPGTKMELSRACIHRDYRNGTVMALLWRGVSRYMQKVEADYIFGCASVKTVWQKDVDKLCSILQNRGHLSDEFQIRPKVDYQMDKGTLLTGRTPSAEDIPALFEGYLRAGAIVSPVPALDREFRCVDFLTILKVAEMDKLFERRYAK